MFTASGGLYDEAHSESHDNHLFGHREVAYAANIHLLMEVNTC